MGGRVGFWELVCGLEEEQRGGGAVTFFSVTANWWPTL
jgi:hypothetical protein